MKLLSSVLKNILVPVVLAVGSVSPLAFAQSSTAAAESYQTDEALLQYQKNSQSFDWVVSQLQPEKRNQIQRLMQGLYFIDFGHAAPELLEMFMGQKKISEIRFPELYDLSTEPAFRSYTQARQFLHGLKTPLSFALVQQMHKLAVPWENSSGQGPGTIRQRFVYGPEFQHGLYPDQLQAINQNPYLYFMEGTGIHADVPQGVDQAHIDNRVRGAIVYPRPRDLKPEIMQRLQASNPAVAQKVLQYQAEHGHEYSNFSEPLTQELIAALLKERIDSLEKDIARIGDLSSPQAVHKYIQLIARFQKDYVSIHPFPDGNGRTSRLLLNFLAERAGLPPPRIVYPNEDLFWSVDMWEKQVREGMLASIRLKQDLMQRLRTGRPLEKSVALLTPVLPKEDLNDFETHVRSQFQNDPHLKTRLLQDPVGTMRGLEHDYKPKARTCSAIHRAS